MGGAIFLHRNTTYWRDPFLFLFVLFICILFFLMIMYLRATRRAMNGYSEFWHKPETTTARPAVAGCCSGLLPEIRKYPLIVCFVAKAYILKVSSSFFIIILCYIFNLFSFFFSFFIKEKVSLVFFFVTFFFVFNLRFSVLSVIFSVLVTFYLRTFIICIIFAVLII